KVLSGAAKNFRKNFSDAVKNYLPVGERHVQSAFHRGEIIATFGRVERRACQLAIQNFDAVIRLHHFQEPLKIISCDLMSEAAAAAVKHHHDLIWNRNSEFFRELRVANVVWPSDLHLQIMVPTSERSDLIVATLNCALADFRCVGACDATVLLGKLQI